MGASTEEARQYVRNYKCPDCPSLIMVVVESLDLKPSEHTLNELAIKKGAFCTNPSCHWSGSPADLEPANQLFPDWRPIFWRGP